MTKKEVLTKVNEFYDNIDKFDKWDVNPDLKKDDNQTDLTKTFNTAVTALDGVIKLLSAERDNKVWEMRKQRDVKGKKIWEGK